MSPTALLALVAVGFAVGFLAGLVGIGGGVLIVPFLYLFYGHAGWSGVELPLSLQATVAHATSLLVIVPTAVAGTLTYARSRLVVWRAVLPIAAFSTVAATAGALVATRIPSQYLKLGFGVFLIFTAVQLMRQRGAHVTDRPVRAGLGVAALTGTAVGLLSALLGVGGGLVAIPLLLYVMRLQIEQVAATSLAIVAFAATAGSLTYMAAGMPATMPAGSIGLVHVAAALPMLPGAMLAARWGARANQRLDAARLRPLFAVLFGLLGARLLIANVLVLIGG
jgi:uncharacterized protein